MLGTDEDGAVALPYFRRRLFLVERRGLGWATGRGESPRAMARFEVFRPLDGTLSWIEPDFSLQVLGNDEDGAVALPYDRRRLVLVEQRDLG